ncbi:MAG TPA: C-terminal helicase domain-containing protein, partial [Propionibacteriaceae bacterium]
LIFSEYVDTAAYIAAALTEAGLERVALVSGDTANPDEYARRFSPYSNLLPDETTPAQATLDSPIDVLVATDVLSEGQNLQDAHIVVNYDLPWAIIRIIQRAGRVDRIGQKSDTVTVYTIVHDKIEQQINLRSRIKTRLGAAASAFGSDEQFFGSSEEVHLLENLYEGVLDDVDDSEGEADAVSEAWLIWSNAQQKHPQIARRVLDLQDLVGSSRDPYVHEKTGRVACYVATASGIDAFAQHLVRDGQTIQELLTPLEALRIFAAEPTTATVPQRPDHFTLQEELIRGPLAAETAPAGALKGIRKWAWLKLGGDTLFSVQAADALNALHARPLTEYAANQLALARRNRYSLDDLAELLNRLHGEERLTIGATDADLIRLVCSIGVVD